MLIEKIQTKTLQTLLEMEKKEKYSDNVPLQEAVKRQYNISRTLDEYLKKFPSLINYLIKGHKILEIGAGEGIAFNTIINKYGLEGTATNVEKFKGKDFLKAFASNLPFEDNSFDIVISIHSITWEPNQKKSIQEVLRVLKKGGIGFINLYKFSEISELWFGNDFLDNQSKDEYRKEFEFDELTFKDQNIDIKKEIALDGHQILSYNYFITIQKP